MKFPEKIEENASNVEFIVQTMKNATLLKYHRLDSPHTLTTPSSNRSETLTFSTIAGMYRLFAHFSEMKNPNALYIYKELVQSLIDNHADLTMREFYF